MLAQTLFFFVYVELLYVENHFLLKTPFVIIDFGYRGKPLFNARADFHQTLVFITGHFV
jgi:hypothetical protein